MVCSTCIFPFLCLEFGWTEYLWVCGCAENIFPSQIGYKIRFYRYTSAISAISLITLLNIWGQILIKFFILMDSLLVNSDLNQSRVDMFNASALILLFDDKNVLFSEIRRKIIPLVLWWLTVKFDGISMLNKPKADVFLCRFVLCVVYQTEQSSPLRACLSTAPHLRFPATFFTSAQKLINNLRP